jgi:hypothetical protein
MVFENAIVSEIILVALIAIVLYIVFKIGKLLLRIIFGIIANSILGIITIFVLNYVFSLGIQIDSPVIASAALFGLPAVGTIVIFRLFGIPV